MRLIDADYLKNILNNGGSESVNINISKSMSLGDIVDTVIMAYRKCLLAELEKVPTAYDLDKVVEQLESQKNQHFRRAEEIKNKFGESYESQRLFSKACSYDNAIQIVKSGGIE